MKIHTKKKLYQAIIHKLALEGKINDASTGNMVPRESVKNSMQWNYYPQRLRILV